MKLKNQILCCLIVLNCGLMGLLPLFPLLPISAEAGISQSECIAFDHSSKMGPVRDQRQNGLCWAFSGTALIEEELCYQNPSLCGKSLSPLDASRCEWPIGKKEQGGLARFALNCALQNGICLEKDAPYNDKTNMDFSCTKTGATVKATGDHGEVAYALPHPNCADPASQREYQEFMSQHPSPLAQVICSGDRGNKSSLLNDKSLANLVTPSEDAADNFICRERDDKLTPDALFRKKMLLPKSCKENRIQVARGNELRGISKNFPGGIKKIKKTKAEDKYQQLSQILKQNDRSVSLSVCANKISPELSKMFNDPADGCAGHAVVANGSRWHNGRCELSIKNSWGDIPEDSPVNGQLNGWVDAEKILDATFELEYVTAKKKIRK